MIPNYIVVIPARYESTRLPGKPLVNIAGKALIQRVYEQCAKAVERNLIYVATDDDRIRSTCESFGAKVIMTSSQCLTGTDRVAEVAKKIKVDSYINVQGDEPIIKPNDIDKIYKYAKKNRNEVINGYAKIKNYSELKNPNIPKVVFDNKKNLMYISRHLIPFVKNRSRLLFFLKVYLLMYHQNMLLIFLLMRFYLL